jgi:hypothetical protein
MKYAWALQIFMEARAVVGFFTLQGINPKNIQAELTSVCEADTLILRAICKWHKRFVQERTELVDDPRSGPPLPNGLAEALRAMPQECHFLLYKILCSHFKLAMAMCLQRLYDVLLLKKFNLRCYVPTLDSNQKAEHGAHSSELVEMLTSQERKVFNYVIKSGESWFHFEYMHAAAWVPSRDKVPETIKQ